MPRKYPEEFKRDVVGQALRPDRTIRDVAEDLGLAATTVQLPARSKIRTPSEPLARASQPGTSPAVVALS